MTTVVAVIALVIGTVAPAAAASAAVASASAASVPATVTGGPVKTSLVGFQAGNIISDAVFTDESTMTEAQIQSFFNSKVTTCRSGYTCLKDFRIDSVNRTADAYCKGYTGAARESAARIIYRVSQSCNINPRVLIVMLQKEQGLVTHTWPSQWRYDKALGQGCPDDAPCNPAYVGFFHQIYGAARQMQIYMEGRYFTWYAPGKTWGILYHPNRACGTSPVYVANKATSALYYYTPYQPNAAALRAGYGTGDGCSSYGNRNFYNYFTDWFGSTRDPHATQGLVKVGTAVWLLAGKNRYHVTAEAYPEYKAVLGAPVVVSSSVLTAYAEGPRGSFYVKNASTGVVAFLQAGATHRFPTCALVGAWGGTCGTSLVVLTDSQFSRFQKGAEMTSFGRLAAAGRIHQMSGAQLVPYFDDAAVKSVNGGAIPYAAVIPAAIAAGRTIDRVRFAPATFVKAAGAPEVWLPTGDGKLHHLPSWQQAAELGFPGAVGANVAAADLAGYTKAEPLSGFAVCGGTTYAAASGRLSALPGSAPSGFAPVVLDQPACAKLSMTGPAVQGTDVFVRFDDAVAIHHVSGGQYRPVSADQAKAINGDLAPTVLVAKASYRTVVRVGQPYPAAGTFVRASGTPEVWLVDGADLVHLPSWPMAREYGLPSSEKIVDAATLAGMERRPSLTPFARCGDGVYLAAGGALRAVAPSRLGDNTATALSSAVCASRTTGSVTEAPVFVTDGSRTSVAVGGGFLRLPDEASITRAAAGAPVVRHRVAPAYLDRLPQAAVPGEGDLARASNEATVTLLDGSRRLGIPNWGVAADLGVQPRYRVVPPAALAPRPIGGPVLGIFVSCGAQRFVAGRGELHPVELAAIGGFTPVPLSAATCKALKLRTAPALKTLQLTSGDGKFYALSGGRLVPTSRNAAVTLITTDARTIAGMPKG